MLRPFRSLIMLGVLLSVIACGPSKNRSTFPDMPQNARWLPADQSSAFRITAGVGIVRVVPDKQGRGGITFSVLLESKDGTPHHSVGGTVYLDKALQPYIESGLMVFGSMEGDGADIDPHGPSKGLSLERVAYVPAGRVDDALFQAARSPMKLLIWFDDGAREFLEIPSDAIVLTVVDRPLVGK